MPAEVHYVLRDLGGSQPGAAKPQRTMLIAWSSASAFYDSTGLAYSRDPGARAWYRFASWSERPAAQLARLLQHRLVQTQAFRDVASTTDSVQGEWLLELELEEMYHDDTTPPGVARISVLARLVDRGQRRTIARQRFDEEEPLQAESASQAVSAFDRATTRLLDALVQWVLDRAQSRA